MAAELKCFSVELNGVVWTLHHSMLFGKNQDPGQQREHAEGKGSETQANSQRRERSAQRLKDFQKAKRNWLAIIFRRWKRMGSPQLPAPPLPQLPPPPMPLLPPAQPPPTASATQQQPQQQQMDDERAPKRGVDESKAPDGSPSTPRAKRTLALGQPPPSIPPSPPSPHPSPPPTPEGSKPSKKISTSNGQGTRVGSRAPREDASRSPVVPESILAYRVPEVPVPRQCYVCERHVPSGFMSREDPTWFFCSRCAQDLGKVGSSDPWESEATGFQCKGCSHVLPYLHDWRNQMCKRCVKRRACDDLEAELYQFTQHYFD